MTLREQLRLQHGDDLEAAYEHACDVAEYFAGKVSAGFCRFNPYPGTWAPKPRTEPLDVAKEASPHG